MARAVKRVHAAAKDYGYIVEGVARNDAGEDLRAGAMIAKTCHAFALQQTRDIFGDRAVLNNGQAVEVKNAAAVTRGYVSGHGGIGNRCLISGMDDYISKPIRPKILFDTIFKWCRVLEANKDLVENDVSKQL